MKKTILTIMATMCVMGIIGGGVISEVDKYYRNELAETSNAYEEEIQELTMGYETEIQELMAENVELATEMYYMEQAVSEDNTNNEEQETNTYTAKVKEWVVDKIHLVTR